MLEATVTDLAAKNRIREEGDVERALLRARYDGFMRTDRSVAVPPGDGSPDPIPIDPLVGLPVTHAMPSPALLRGTIERHGSVVVRGMIDRTLAEDLRQTVEAALRAREAALTGGSADPDWYFEFEPINNKGARGFTSFAGMLAADSPRGHFRMTEALYRSGAVDVASGFFGTRPALSVEKSVLRRVEPGEHASWHQDGAFLGESIQTLDVWIALTDCGRTAPGLEVFPTRVDRVLPTGAYFDWDLHDKVLAEHYPHIGGVVPEFAVGDGIIFDQLCVHRSAYAPGMKNARYAIECWLFSPASVPADYTGLLL